MVESFFHTLKTELIYERKFKKAYEVVADIIEYLSFYKQERLYTSLEYPSPAKYEKSLFQKNRNQLIRAFYS